MALINLDNIILNITRKSTDEVQKENIQQASTRNYVRYNQDRKDLPKKYDPPFETQEQSLRDQHVTDLLYTYVDTYKTRTKCNFVLKLIVFLGAMIWISVFVIIIYQTANRTLFERLFTNTATTITVCVSGIASILGILKIIVTYLFPADEEKYITQIVQLIQDNDLETKKLSVTNTTVQSTQEDALFTAMSSENQSENVVEYTVEPDDMCMETAEYETETEVVTEITTTE